MLTQEAIRRALHADRVTPLAVANPHGPLGLEQLAITVAAIKQGAQPDRVRRPIALPTRTWEKLHALAAATSQAGTPPLSAGELAAAIIEQYVLDAAS